MKSAQITMIGIDIADVKRIEKIANEAFLSRIFCDSERAYIVSRHNSPQTITGLFCAKEAVVKALGTGFGNGISFKQIEITHSQLGQPLVTLSGEAAKVLSKLGEKINLSISHTDTQAVAIAQISGKPTE